MHHVTLPRLGTFDAWRQSARALALAQVPPEEITWRMAGAEAGLFDDEDTPLPPPGDGTLTVSKAFPALARLLCASRDAQAFDLAYRLLCRQRGQPGLLSNRADAEVSRAQVLAKNVRRDMHKMKAFVRFREVTPENAGRRQFLSWFEPDHRIEEPIAGFFQRRFGDMDWAIVTPDVTTHCKDGQISQKAIPSDRLDLTDETETLWQTYYANIFNPARLKIRAMQSEMPKKYWKNLPEAAMIPGLIAEAEARVAEMREAAPTLPPLRAQRLSGTLVRPEASGDTLAGCTRCPLARTATQAVPGEGPAPAALMIVGEQPGEAEDLAGRPFVGPAGQLFDRLAQEAGLDRHAAYVTNAVKHFKFQVRGKRRIHQSPNASEVSHCRWWLTQEIARVQPRLILALGATAALALTGNGKGITARAGRIEQGIDGIPVLLTLHPAALLRHPDPETRRRLTDQLRGDLEAAVRMLPAADRLPSA